MNWKKGIKRILVAFGILIGLQAMLVTIVVISGMTIRLDFLRPPIERGASEAMGRPVKVQGSIELIPNLRPTITISGMEIGNPPDWPQNQFVSVAMARTQIDILDLLAREISIGEITAEGIVLQLISDDLGRNNWIIVPAEKDQKPKTKVAAAENVPPDTAVSPDERRVVFTALDRLSLTNIVVHYHDAVMNKTLEFKIDDGSHRGRCGRGQIEARWHHEAELHGRQATDRDPVDQQAAATRRFFHRRLGTREPWDCIGTTGHLDG